jgi:hypothetical protein
MNKSEPYIKKLNQLVVLMSTSSGARQELQVIRKLVHDLKEGFKLLDQVSEAPVAIEDPPVQEVVEEPVSKKKTNPKGKKYIDNSI